MKDTVQEVSLKDVYLDRETQIRAKVSEETIQRYYEVMADEEGRDKFPPILLFRDDEGNYWLADGHHRVMAAIRRKFTSIMAIIRPGTKADAIWEAAKANSKNGLQLGRADTRRAITMILAVFSDRTNRMIAEVIGCDEKTVRLYRPSQSVAENSATEKRKGKDGKMYQARRNRKAKTKPDTAPQSPPVAKTPAQAGNVAQAAERATDANECGVSETTADRRRIEANVKETQILGTISQLRIQIGEWFELAIDDMHEGFDQRIRPEIKKLID